MPEERRTTTTAPAPDDDRKPDSPTDLDKRSWRYVLVKSVREFSADECMDAAAGLTYYAVLALFPALIAIFSLLGVFGQGGAVADAVLGIVEDAAPPDIAETLRGPIEQVSQAPGAGLALVIGLALALWSASGYVGAFGRAMNRVYEIQEGRPFWKLRPTLLLVTLIGVVALTIVGLALVLSGDVADAVSRALGLGETVRIMWEIAKWPLLIAIIVTLVAILYYATPNAKQPKFRWLSVGAILAIVVLGIGTAVFFVYVSNFSNYDRTYGSLAGVIVLLLWLWIANIALLFGAEVDAELERGRQLQAGIAAEEDIQLPARDTRQSDKRAEKEERDVEEGRRIREAHQDDAGGDRDGARRS